MSRITARREPTLSSSHTTLSAPAETSSSSHEHRFERSSTPSSEHSFLTTALPEKKARSVLQVLFSPFDETLQQELDLIDEVIAARKTDGNRYEEGSNPYKIQYAVYNLRHPEIVERLVKAEQAGVDVQVLVDDRQLKPGSPKSTEIAFRDASMEIHYNHRELTDDEKISADYIAIKGSGIMHMKARYFTYRGASGKAIEKLLTGSLNPTETAGENDDNILVIEDKNLIAKYKAKYQSLLNNTKMENTWNSRAALNVLFSRANGPSPTKKIFQWIDREKEAIFISMYALRNVSSKGHREKLLEKLKKAVERGVKVAVITDKKLADGRSGRHDDDPTEDLIRELSIPVFEVDKSAGITRAMHHKWALFGLSNMRLVTDSGNWSESALGSENRGASNDESYLFINSHKLDKNATGLRYLSAFVRMLYMYEDQQSQESNAFTLIKDFTKHPNWPKVEVDFSSILETYPEKELYISGNHASISYRKVANAKNVELPFGHKLDFVLLGKDSSTGDVSFLFDQEALLLVDPASHPSMPEHLTKLVYNLEKP